MTKLNNLILAASISFLPAFVFIITDIASALFIAPFLFIIFSFISAIIWFTLIIFKIRDELKHFLLLILMVPLSVYIGITNHHNYTPEGCFERLLFSPVPSSIKFIDYHGITTAPDGYEVLVFTLLPEHLDLIIKTKKFEEFKLNEIRENSEYNKKIIEAKKYGITTPRMYSLENVGYLLLLVNESKNKAFLYSVRI